jgi:hypothetical protein
MAVDNAKLRIVTRAARMQLMAEQLPDHNGVKDHEKQLKILRGRWAELEDEDKVLAAKEAEQFPDMTPELIEAAVAALEH